MKLLETVPDLAPTELLDDTALVASYAATAAKMAKTPQQIAAEKAAIVTMINAIMTKQCNKVLVLRMCQDGGVDHTDALPALLAVMRKFRPEQPVTEADITAATTGLEINARFVQRELPKILDALKITTQYDGKKRRFASMKELNVSASTTAKLVDSCVTVGAAVAAHAAGLVIQSPYVGRDTSGAVVTHLRPAQTEAGKEARRKVKEAEFIAKQELKALGYRNAAREAALGKDPYATTGQAGSWTMPAVIVAGIVVLAVIAGMRGTETPAQPNQAQLVEQMGVTQ